MAKWRTKNTAAAAAASGAPKSSGAIVEKRDDKATEKGGEEVIISVVVHCEGCARKLRRSLQRPQGIDEVIVDCRTNTVVVKGQQALENPMKLVENVETRTGNKAVLLSPSLEKLPPPSKQEDSNKDAAEKSMKDDLEGVYMEMVVVLRIEMHCDACSDEIKRRILKIKGVKEAVLHLKASQLTVKGTIEPATLVGFIHRCTGKKASIVKAEPVHPPSPAATDMPLMEAEAPTNTDAQQHRSDSQQEKKEGVEENKKERNMGEEEDDVDNEKLKNEKVSEGKRTEEETQVDKTNDPSVGLIQENDVKDHVCKLAVPVQVVAAAPEFEKMTVGNGFHQYNYRPSYCDYAYPPYAYPQYEYQQLHSYVGNPTVYADPLYPPQSFSDENPEACSIM